MRTAATSDGRLLGRDVECWFDTGAYADNGPRSTATGGDAAPGPYRWDGVPRRRPLRLHEHRARPAATARSGRRTCSGSARARSTRSRAAWARSARAPPPEPVPAGRGDPRRRQAARRRPGRRRRAGGGGRRLGRAEGAAGRARRVGRTARGGCAPGLDAPSCGWRPTAASRCSSGTTEMGQGPRTVFAQIAAEVLGIEAETVVVRGTDSRFTPYDRSTGASRSTTLAGLAVMRAAEDVRTQLEEIAGAPELEPATLSRPDRAPLRAGRRRADRTRRGAPRGHAAPTPRARSSGRSASARRRSSVDPDTGVVEVLRTATVADVGRAINPQLVERQDEGATMQGIGNALLRGDAVRGRLPAELDPARLPRADVRGHAGRR